MGKGFLNKPGQGDPPTIQVPPELAAQLMIAAANGGLVGQPQQQPKVNIFQVGSYMFFWPPLHGQINAVQRTAPDPEEEEANFEGITLFTIFGHTIDLDEEDSSTWKAWFDSQQIFGIDTSQSPDSAAG